MYIDLIVNYHISKATLKPASLLAIAERTATSTTETSDHSPTGWKTSGAFQSGVNPDVRNALIVSAVLDIWKTLHKSLPIEHLDLLNVSPLRIDALECLTHYFSVSADHLVHRHGLLTIRKKGDVPVAWRKQRFNRRYTFR
jgi:hypothetical protein